MLKLQKSNIKFVKERCPSGVFDNKHQTLLDIDVAWSILQYLHIKKNSCNTTEKEIILAHVM